MDDPDQSLGEMIGINLEEAGKKSIAELLEDTFIGKGGTTVGTAPSDRIEDRIWKDGLYEDDSFDFLAIGTKWIEGCYCMPDAALKQALNRLSKQYRYVIVDAPGGLEHLNRRITENVDDIFDILGPSHKSLANLDRAKRVIRESGITFSNLYTIGGHLFPEEMEKNLIRSGTQYLGAIASDPEIARRNMAGESLLGMDPGSPGPVSVAAILRAAGY
jgi:CO dehydrogenase maturation factor